jgi:DNA polymerase-1
MSEDVGLIKDADQIFPEWVKERSYTRISDLETLARVFNEHPDLDAPMALDTETTSLDRLTARILGFSFAFTEGEAFWVPITTGEEFKLLADAIKDRFVLFYNANYDLPILERHGVKIGRFEDAMCLVWLENPNAHMRGLKEASRVFLGREMVELKSFFSGKKAKVNFELLPADIATPYACMDADATLCLYNKLQNIKALYPKIWGIEMALVRPTIEMEQNGIDIDIDLLRDLSIRVGNKIAALKAEIYKLAGEEFNTNSPVQVNKILYDKLKLPCKRQTKTGNRSSGEDALKLIQERHKIIPLLLAVGSLQQKREGFLDALPGRVNSTTGRIHCNLKQWNVTTGRYSSANPNLQNIPKAKLEDRASGLIIRDAFVANPTKAANDNPGDEDWVFIDGDYSQIELRVAASLSGEPVWVNAYLLDEDVHIDTAKGIFHTEHPTEDQRSKAKTGNFGMLTGQSGYAFAMEMGITPDAGDAFVEAWYAALPELSKWMNRERQRARDTGYAQTFWGRRRTMGLTGINNINCFDQKLRAHWERSVCSHIIQGTAADIMKLAIVLVRRAILKAGWQDDVKTLLTVHDQLLFKVRKRLVPYAIPVITEAMEIKIAGWVPMKFQLQAGTRWGSCTKIEEYTRVA